MNRSSAVRVAREYLELLRSGSAPHREVSSNLGRIAGMVTITVAGKPELTSTGDVEAVRSALLKMGIPRDRVNSTVPAFASAGTLSSAEVNKLLRARVLTLSTPKVPQMTYERAQAQYKRAYREALAEMRDALRDRGADEPDLGTLRDLARASFEAHAEEFRAAMGWMGMRAEDVINSLVQQAG